MKGYLLFLAILVCCCSVVAMNLKEVPKLDQSAMMKMLIDKGPFSKWLSYKSQITKADIEEIKMHARRSEPDALTPVIIIPSLIGSVLTATLKDFNSSYFYCPKTWNELFYLWIDDSDGFLFYLNCWFEHMTLQFDPHTNLSSSAPGVNVDIKDYGGVRGVDYMDASRTIGGWNDTIAVLTSLGYEIGKNIRAAPFDWRRGPLEYFKYDFPLLKQLVEETYTANNNSPIAFVSLSMGGPYFLSFLNNFVSQEWKDKYVHSYSSWDGAFGGSVASIAALTNSNFLPEYLGPLLAPWGTTFLTMMQSFPSFLWMFPLQEYLAKDNVTVSTGLYGSFTTTTWYNMLLAAKEPNLAQQWANFEYLNLTRFQAPGVRTYCVFGYGIPTLRTYTLESDFSSKYNGTFADGDMTVLINGLDICTKFQPQQSKTMTAFPVKGMVHGSSVHNKEVIAYFVKRLFSSE